MAETQRVSMSARDPDLARLREVAKASREGKTVCFPTETVYGIGGPMSVPGLSEKLKTFKADPRKEPEVVYHIGDWAMLDHLRIFITPVFRFLSRTFWPGPLTLTVKDSAGKILKIRYPRNLLATALINSVGEPFLAVSASGDEPARTPERVLSGVPGFADYVVDSGPCEIGEDSTVVDITDEKNPRITRKGPRAAEIEKVLEKIRAGRFARRKILIVCTGNSCRSPMAEGWLKDELERRGLSDEVEVSSCGVGTRDGMPATAEAVYVMRNREVDIADHRSKQCTREDILGADLILAMSQQHALFITSMMPSAREKIKILNVMDPIGMNLSVYEDVMNLIEKKITSLWFDIVG
ncbi:MAG: hypothetical protein FGM27_01860 [Candidatus Omnitrophica bacterium]|nr:hypothetical protein [Candidatus Omnitrophota bacterium]